MNKRIPKVGKTIDVGFHDVINSWRVLKPSKSYNLFKINILEKIRPVSERLFN